MESRINFPETPQCTVLTVPWLKFKGQLHTNEVRFKINFSKNAYGMFGALLLFLPYLFLFEGSLRGGVRSWNW